MSLKPWREIARPHKDVLEGSFKQSEFAADITAVATGKATDDYQDEEKFFSSKFITEGMNLLLMYVDHRLSGVGCDPVIQLQTAFGGGKTHTMLAVMHLANRKVSTDKFREFRRFWMRQVSQSCQLQRLQCDGINLSVSQGKQHGSICANTLWGELAWRLMGEKDIQWLQPVIVMAQHRQRMFWQKFFNKRHPVWY